MYIAVHDGARPLVTREIIRECFDKAQEFGAAAAARPVTETLKRSDVDGFSRGVGQPHPAVVHRNPAGLPRTHPAPGLPGRGRAECNA